jgi:hypothetical protein
MLPAYSVFLAFRKEGFNELIWIFSAFHCGLLVPDSVYITFAPLSSSVSLNIRRPTIFSVNILERIVFLDTIEYAIKFRRLLA